MNEIRRSKSNKTETLIRWAMFLAIITLGIWVCQGIHSFLNQSTLTENPFADSITPPPPNRVAASVEIQDHFSQVADQPNGYVAFVNYINAQGIYLQIARFGDSTPTQAIAQVCYDVVSIYERFSPSTDYPPPNYLAMQLPAQQVTVAYQDVVDYVNGDLNLGEFQGRWLVGRIPTSPPLP